MWFLVGFQPRLWGAVVFLCAAHESYKHTVTSLLLGLFCGNKQILFDCDCRLPYYRPYHKRGWITCLARKLGLKETWEQNLTEAVSSRLFFGCLLFFCNCAVFYNTLFLYCATCVLLFFSLFEIWSSVRLYLNHDIPWIFMLWIFFTNRKRKSRLCRDCIWKLIIKCDCKYCMSMYLQKLNLRMPFIPG